MVLPLVAAASEEVRARFGAVVWVKGWPCVIADPRLASPIARRLWARASGVLDLTRTNRCVCARVCARGLILPSVVFLCARVCGSAYLERDSRSVADDQSPLSLERAGRQTPCAAWPILFSFVFVCYLFFFDVRDERAGNLDERANALGEWSSIFCLFCLLVRYL